MLGFLGKWASSKGMGKIPNLIGLTKNQARQALQDAGFNYGNENEEIQADESLTNKVKSQSKAHNDLYDYEDSVDYVIHTFSFTPYSFTPYSFTPIQPYSFTPETYSFTPVYSFTPYSFTPYSFTPYSFTPIAEVTCGPCQNSGNVIVIDTCNGEDSYEGYWQPQQQVCSDGTTIDCPNVFIGYGSLVEANSVACGGSGTYSFTPYSFTPYSFTPQDCTPVASGVETRMCNGSLTPVTIYVNPCTGAETWTCPEGPYSFTPYSFTPYSFTPYSFTPASSECPPPGLWSAWSSCVNGVQTRTRTNYDNVSGCPPYIEEETRSCESAYSFTPTAPYSFTPFTFIPAYSFTPMAAYSFTPEAPYSFTPMEAYSFTPEAPYTFTPFSFVPFYTFVPMFTFTPMTYSFTPESTYTFTPFSFIPGAV